MTSVLTRRSKNGGISRINSIEENQLIISLETRLRNAIHQVRRRLTEIGETTNKKKYSQKLKKELAELQRMYAIVAKANKKKEKLPINNSKSIERFMMGFRI
jgi:hypothetical protein